MTVEIIAGDKRIVTEKGKLHIRCSCGWKGKVASPLVHIVQCPDCGSSTSIRQILPASTGQEVDK